MLCEYSTLTSQPATRHPPPSPAKHHNTGQQGRHLAVISLQLQHHQQHQHQHQKQQQQEDRTKNINSYLLYPVKGS